MHFVCDFTRKAVMAVYQTMLSLKVEPVEHAEGAAMPTSFAGNRCSIPELKEELNVRVFAKLDA